MENKTESRIGKTIVERRSDWTTRDERARHAENHHNLCLNIYQREIERSVTGSRIYGGDHHRPSICRGTASPEHLLLNIDSVSALFEITEPTGSLHHLIKDGGKICLLNFASYKNAGGGFMYGSSAQEEALCHESTLYEVLSDSRLASYYEWNNLHKNRGMYLDRALYSPDICFDRDGLRTTVDVLTCAAPNIGTAARYGRSDDEENGIMLGNRCQFIADILKDNNVTVFIAGAWGCGVFGQWPDEVCRKFVEARYDMPLKAIVHPVIGSNNNYLRFAEVLEKTNKKDA